MADWVAKIFAGIGVLDILDNGAMAVALKKSPNLAVKVLTLLGLYVRPRIRLGSLSTDHNRQPRHAVGQRLAVGRESSHLGRIRATLTYAGRPSFSTTFWASTSATLATGKPGWAAPVSSAVPST